MLAEGYFSTRGWHERCVLARPVARAVLDLQSGEGVP